MLYLWGAVLNFILNHAFLHYDPYIAPIRFSWQYNLSVPPWQLRLFTGYSPGTKSFVVYVSLVSKLFV